MATEKRLIDANAVLAKQFTSGLSDASGNYYGYADVVFVNDIENAPTVDAVEVVHGRWECTYDEKTGETDVTCSHCKDTRTINGCYVTSAGESCYFDDNYCPNCGAKMDGGA